MSATSVDNATPPVVPEDEEGDVPFAGFSDKHSDPGDIIDDLLNPEDEYYVDFQRTIKGEYSWGSFGERDFWEGEGTILCAFYSEQEEGEAMEEGEEDLYMSRIPSFQVKKTRTKEPPTEEHRRRSLFVHSSPTHFPDINKARKSVFGSIFVRTTADVAEEMALLKTVIESSYTMLQALLSSFEKILSAPSTDKDRKQKTLEFKDSVQKALESHGICKTYADGSVHWDIYPITQNYLFSIQIGDNLHQTRHLNKIGDRLLSGSAQKSEFPHLWPTNSTWAGQWSSLGMNGTGVYIMPHGVSYSGKMQDGMFHDQDGTLTYPNKFKAINCVFEKGKLMDCGFQFPDLLMHENTDWKYCKFPDRRFWSEVQDGLKPAKIAQKTQTNPPKKIPPGAYDTSDGFYYPKSLMLLSYYGELLRVPVCAEDNWIKKYCRKGFLEPTNFRPDLFENWFNHDEELIQSILNEQKNFRAGKITYEELQQFYADLGLLPSCSTHKKRKSSSEIAFEEYIKSIPEPKRLEPRRVKKYEGHYIPDEVLAACQEEMEFEAFRSSEQKVSKSFLKFSKHLKLESSQAGVTQRASKISSKVHTSSLGKDGAPRRKIPEKYLKYQPLLKLPFERGSKPCTPDSIKSWRKCVRKGSSESSDSLYLGPEDRGYSLENLRRKNLEKFMKSIILDIITKILLKERERHRRRFIWGRKFPSKDPGPRKGTDEKCMKVLEELFHSIPDREEFCDSDLNRTCDLKKLAEDKHGELKYWGKRIFLLDFHRDSESE